MKNEDKNEGLTWSKNYENTTSKDKGKWKEFENSDLKDADKNKPVSDSTVVT